MKQKEVKINGIRFNHQFGIVQICELTFDEKIKMYVMKGKAGHGKTTTTKGVQLATQGVDTLSGDKDLYGDIDIDVMLTDGETPVYVGCKSNKKGLSYVLFTKDKNGKKINNPVIDGEKATPAQYLKSMQTALTWRMDELISENPSIQKKILLKLYQSGLKKIGIIFDKSHPDYNDSILWKIDEAISARDMADMIRKQKGGIAEDLRAAGNDPDRPETCPDYIEIEEIELSIKAVEKEITKKTTNSESIKEKDLADIKTEAANLVNECLGHNAELKAIYDQACKTFKNYSDNMAGILNQLHIIENACKILEIDEIDILKSIKEKINYPKEIKEPESPIYIIFDENKKIDSLNYENLSSGAKKLLDFNEKLKQKYIAKYSEPKEFDPKELNSKLENLELSKKAAIENNKIVDAIDSFHKYRGTKEVVVRLKNEYIKLLAEVDTGVEGLKIVPIENNIHLMYDGSYDPIYFKNKEKKLIKVSAYSGTQKPIICMLIQNSLLNKMPKCMRYMYIDNIPLDIASKALIEKISKELNLHIFLNMTGDFSKESLQDGEVLIEGGEVFFNEK